MFFPYTTHVLAEGAIGDEALIAVIRQVKVGDTFEELHGKYPQIFDESILGTSFYSSDGASYQISFDSCRQRVTEVMVKVNSP